MWSAEGDDLEAGQGQRLHLSRSLIGKARSPRNRCWQRAGLPQAHLSGCAGKEGSCARQMCASWEPGSGRLLAHAPCVAGRGSPSSSSSLSGLNCTLAALMTTWCSLQELPRKAEPESSTKGITSCSVFCFFEHTELFHHWGGSSAILGRRTTCPKITQCSMSREVMLARPFLVF